MPVVAPAVLAGAIAATSVTAGVVTFSIATFAIVAGGTLALGLISSALAPSLPKGNGLASQRQSQNVNYRQAVTNHMLVYGQIRVGGPIVFMSSTGENEYLHMVIVLACHKLASIDEVWVDDYCVPNDWLDANGNVTQGKFFVGGQSYLRIRKHLGETDQLADSLLVGECPEWSINHRLQGLPYIYVRLRGNQNVWTGGVPNFSAIVRGREIFDPRSGQDQFSPNPSLFASDYLQDPIYGPQALAQDVDAANTLANANICDEIVTTLIKDSVITAIDTGTNIITLTGDFLPFQVGDRVEIVTTGSAPGGLAVDTDYYVIPYQFKDKGRILLAETLEDAIALNPIDITSAGSGTNTVRKTGEPRYHAAGIIDSGNTIADNLEDILSAMGAKPSYVGGAWTIKPQIWTAPALLLNEGDMRGAIDLQTKTSRRERFNSVAGQYCNPMNWWQPADYPTQRDPNYVSEDQIELPRNMDLPFTTRAETAQRIALVELRRSRQEMTVNIPFSMKAFLAAAGDNIELTSERLGWENKPFEVTELTLVSESGGMTVNLALRETAEECFDWNANLATNIDPAPNTNLNDGRVVQIPTGVAYDSRNVLTEAGDRVFNLFMTWDLHSDSWVREKGFMEIMYKPSADTDFRPSFRVAGNLIRADIISTSVNTEYDLAIRAINNLGVPSQWVYIYGAVAGSSGGSTSEDWGLVTDGTITTDDYGLVTDSVGSDEDWEYV